MSPKFSKILGISLISLSLLMWVLVLLLPMSSLEAHHIAWVAVALVISAKILFYSGIFFLGKEYFKKIKKYFNYKYWFKKNVPGK